MILYISVVSMVTSPFSFQILLIWVLSLFFLMSLAKKVYQFFCLLKEPAFSFIDLCYVFFVLISFISAVIFMISFLLLTLGLICSSFSSCSTCKVRLFIWKFSCFWGRILFLWTSLLELLLLHPIGFESSRFGFHFSLGTFWFPL